jgi:pyruvate/2-oxoglutarate dehydrogenase complex dihydrolipoamide dehydrogenase (E3) component
LEADVSDQQQFEFLIIGSGEAAKHLAWTMSKAGRRTAVVERKLIGGSCPNIACLPSKNVIHSAKVAHLARHGADFGVMMPAMTVDMERVRARKRQMVDDEIRDHLDLYHETGVELIIGEARFISPKTVEVTFSDGGARILTGDQVFLDVGTHAAVPEIPGLQAARPMTHVEVLELGRLPEHLIVVGGGYVGPEFAQAMRRFGSRVTVLEAGRHLAALEDHDVSEAILQLLRDEGSEVLLDTQVLGVEGVSGERVKVYLRTAQGEQVLEGSDLLVATGRVPNTQGLGLESTGVEVDERGYIRVNERLETSAPGIWAMGECAGSPHFTHIAFDDFRVVRDNLTGGNRTTTGRLVPFCMFTDPELARAGLNEAEAQKRQIPYRLAKVPAVAVLRTHTTGETRGFLKVLISIESDEILGFTAFAAEAGEMMAVVETAMLAKLPYTALRDAILAHPTMAEGLRVLFAAVGARPAAQNRDQEGKVAA